MVGVSSFMLGVGADMIMVTLGTDRHWPVFCVWSGECQQQWSRSPALLLSALLCHVMLMSRICPAHEKYRNIYLDR